MTAPDTDETPEAPRRSFGPRRGLPNSRALVGALLVTVAAVGTFVVASGADDRPSTSYLVLTRDVDAGATVSVDDVVAVPMDLAPEVSATVLRSTTGLDGATVLTPLRAGSLVDERDLRAAPSVDGVPVTSVHELTFPVPVDRAPDQLMQGDRVTILAYSSTDAALHTALEHAVVLSYQVAAADFGASDSARLTVALTSADDVATATLLSYESLTVVLTSRVIDDDYPAILRQDPEDAT
ncbi:MAG: hypothetical protein RIB98_06280 [Acidimicrobiales bacterium]